LAISQHAKIKPPSKLRKSLSTSISAAMIPQNRPLDSLKTRIFNGAALRSHAFLFGLPRHCPPTSPALHP
jgi:hypothetical protein